MDAALVEFFLFLLQFLVEVVFQAGLEMLTELSWTSSQKKRPDRDTDNWFFVVIGLFVVGAALGGLSLAVWPDRVVSRGPLPGVSLILAPAAVGTVMHFWGKYRALRGHVTTTLATFAGGAAFALGTAVVRFLWAK